MKKLVTLSVVCAMSAPLAAQWLKEPTKGIPRTADGKPDLSAPAPRTADGKPDLSGLWRIDAGPYSGNLLADLKLSDIAPSADALYKQRMENLGKDDLSTFMCLPQGHRAIFGEIWCRVELSDRSPRVRIYVLALSCRAAHRAVGVHEAMDGRVVTAGAELAHGEPGKRRNERQLEPGLQC